MEQVLTLLQKKNLIRTLIIGDEKEDWVDLTEEVFRDYFKSSPVMRTGLEGLKRNIKFVGK